MVQTRAIICDADTEGGGEVKSSDGGGERAVR